MSEVTQLLDLIRQGNRDATAKLFSLVYDELRRSAQAQMVNERPGHTLASTALVHEVFLRLVGETDMRWEGRGHFFSAAAEAMRRILIEHARGRNAVKRGGGRERLALESADEAISSPIDGLVDLLTLDEALSKLAIEAPAKAELVKLRFFAGLSLEEAAQTMNVSLATAKRYWVFSRAWLFQELEASQ